MTLRHRRLASGVHGLALAAASASVLGRWPALSHALPSPADTTLGLALTLTASIAGGWIGAKLGAALAHGASATPPTSARAEAVPSKAAV